jgi:beta-phosphoglucomutase-like phosphatase (HAD superfamily)
MEALGVLPARCAVVEDTVTGVRAGVAAGATVFGYSPRRQATTRRRRARGRRSADLHGHGGLPRCWLIARLSAFSYSG